MGAEGPFTVKENTGANRYEIDMSSILEKRTEGTCVRLTFKLFEISTFFKYMLLNQREVCTGEILGNIPFFCKFIDQEARQKMKETNIFPVQTEQAIVR